MTPWLSVLMPVYNGGRYLSAALESVVEQNDPTLEVIAVDDGSTDDSLRILGSFEGRLPLSIIREGTTGNWARATNRALTAATGEFVSLLHQDDLWMPGRMALLRRLAAAHPETAMIFHAAIFIDSAGRGIGRWRSPLRSGEYAAGAVVERLLVQNFIAIPVPAVRRTVAERLGGLNEGLWYTADWDFWLRVLAGHACYYHDAPLAAFRLHRESQTVLRSGGTDEFRRQMVTVYDRHQQSAARGVDRAARFSIDVNTALAQLAHGGDAPVGELAWRFMCLGPGGWRRYLRDSRIVERAASRLRLRLHENRNSTSEHAIGCGGRSS